MPNDCRRSLRSLFHGLFQNTDISFFEKDPEGGYTSELRSCGNIYWLVTKSIYIARLSALYIFKNSETRESHGEGRQPSMLSIVCHVSVYRLMAVRSIASCGPKMLMSLINEGAWRTLLQ